MLSLKYHSLCRMSILPVWLYFFVQIRAGMFSFRIKKSGSEQIVLTRPGLPAEKV